MNPRPNEMSAKTRKRTIGIRRIPIATAMKTMRTLLSRMYSLYGSKYLKRVALIFSAAKKKNDLI
jgi:hypothetical protein